MEAVRRRAGGIKIAGHIHQVADLIIQTIKINIAVPVGP